MVRWRWFQFHLLTLLSTTLVASALLYLNVRDYDKIEGPGLRGPYALGASEASNYRCFGWPLYFYSKPIEEEFRWRAAGWDIFAGDLVVVIAIIACVAVTCEWWVRSREKAAARTRESTS